MRAHTVSSHPIFRSSCPQPLPPIKFSASLPKEMVSIVIGRGGAKIQRIMDQSNANVAVEPLTPLFGRMRFKGSPGSILKAQVSAKGRPVCQAESPHPHARCATNFPGLVLL